MNYLNYFLTTCTSILAILLLIKDWHALKYNYIRLSALGLIILLWIGGLLNYNYSVKRNNEQIQQDNVHITKLQIALDTSDKNRQSNTKQFLTEFDRLSEKVSDLQTQVKTTEFKKKVTSLQADLESTRKALIAPKATLSFTFHKSNNDAPSIRTVTLPVKDNVVHIEFAVENRTDIPALDGDLTLMICNSCKFASEPPNFIKLPMTKDNERNMRFERILPKSIIKGLSADVLIPAPFTSMNFGINYRCRNCVVPDTNTTENMGIVTLTY